jgi:putative hydrolase of the HAD superfamily
VTNGRGDLQHAVIAALGFGALIGAVVVSEDVGCSKPGRKIFDVALAALKTEATKAIMVGDNPIADMEGRGEPASIRLPSDAVRTDRFRLQRPCRTSSGKSSSV